MPAAGMWYLMESNMHASFSSASGDTVLSASSQLFPVITGLIASTASLLIVIAAIIYGVRFIRWIAHKLINVSH